MPTASIITQIFSVSFDKNITPFLFGHNITVVRKAPPVQYPSNNRAIPILTAFVKLMRPANNGCLLSIVGSKEDAILINSKNYILCFNNHNKNSHWYLLYEMYDLCINLRLSDTGLDFWMTWIYLTILTGKTHILLYLAAPFKGFHSGHLQLSCLFVRARVCKVLLSSGTPSLSLLLLSFFYTNHPWHSLPPTLTCQTSLLHLSGALSLLHRADCMYLSSPTFTTSISNIHMRS